MVTVVLVEVTYVEGIVHEAEAAAGHLAVLESALEVLSHLHWQQGLLGLTAVLKVYHFAIAMRSASEVIFTLVVGKDVS